MGGDDVGIMGAGCRKIIAMKEIAYRRFSAKNCNVQTTLPYNTYNTQ